MGAWYMETTIKGGNETHVRRRFKAIQDQAAYENGNSYSGDFNMARGLEFTGKTFKSHDEASDYLVKTAQKWDAALVCEYRNDEGQLVWLLGAWCSS